MTERPILFSAAMVRAILAGTKTQTRRAGAYQMAGATELGVESISHATKGYEIQATYRAFPNGGSARWALCAFPYGKIGDRLWVKETFHTGEFAEPAGWLYRATDPGWDDNDCGVKWKPSIFMPRAASRITLEIVNVRVERVQDVSEDDAIAEGVQSVWSDDQGETPGRYLYFTGVTPAGRGHPTAKEAFRELWDSINAKRDNGKFAWSANPWVWVIEFKRINP